MEENAGPGRAAAGFRRWRQLKGDNTEGPSLAELAEVRGATYGLFGALFLFPADEELAEQVALSAELRHQAEAVRGFPFFSAWDSVLDSLVRFDGEAAGRLQEEYVELFLTGASDSPCPLYESAYLERAGPTQGLIGVAVERAYADAGAALAPAAAGELPDHLALELEFVSLLCDEEARAWRAGCPLRAGECLGAQQAFLDAHLLRWLPQLTRRVVQAAAAGSLYRRLAEAVHAFVVHDRDLAGALGAAHASLQTRSVASQEAAGR